MKKITVCAVTVMMASVWAVGSWASDPAAEKHEKKEMKIEWSQVPAAAQKRLTEVSANAKFDELSMEQEEGGAEYEAAWKKGDCVMEAKVTANGDLLATSTTLPESEVPAAVVQAAKQKCAPAGQITYEQKSMILYRVKAVDKDGKECKMTFSPDGHEKMFGMHPKGCKCPQCMGKDAKCDGKDAKCDGKDAKCDGKDAKCDGKDAKCDGKDAKCDGKDAKCDGKDAKCDGKDAKCDGKDAKCDGKDDKTPGQNAQPQANK